MASVTDFVITGFAVAVLVAACSPDEPEKPKVDEMALWDAGEGFKKIYSKQDNLVAYRYTKGFDGAEVKTKDGCDHLFVSAHAYQNDVIVDEDIESVDNVPAGGIVRVSFNFNKGDKYNISEVNCM